MSFAFAAVLLAASMLTEALPPLPTYAERPCPFGWTYNSFDDSCNTLWPRNKTLLGVHSLPSPVSYKEAQAYCNLHGAELPIITDIATQLTWLMDFVGNRSGIRWWIGVHADPSVRHSQRWITRTGRSTGFVFAWDTKRSMPGSYDRCVAMHQVGTNATDGRVLGGNGRMITLDCEELSSVVCTKLRVPVSITGINGEPPHSVVLSYTFPLTLTFSGHRIPNGTLVSLQSMAGLALPDRAPTQCRVVSTVSGVSTPFVLIPSDTLQSSRRLCNGTCMTASITIPETWPFVRGAQYSFCFYVPIPFQEPNDLSEYQNELLGSSATLVIAQHDKDFLRDICHRRTQDLHTVSGDLAAGLDSAYVTPESAMFDSPVDKAEYNVQLAERHQRQL